MLPRGYLQVDGPINQSMADAIKHRWEESVRAGITPIMTSDIKFIPLPQPDPIYPAIVRCGHCGGFAAVQTACVHCGASVL